MRPDCPTGHSPPEHSCDWPNCRCFDALAEITDDESDALFALLATTIAVQRPATDAPLRTIKPKLHSLLRSRFE